MISLALIVKNEESCLRRCLDSVKAHVDEIIIVDTGSKDKTKKIATEYTDKIYNYRCKNDWSFAEARNFAASKCTKNWILFLDADEYLADKHALDLRNLLSITPRHVWEIMPTVFMMAIDKNTPCLIHYNHRLYRNDNKIYWKGKSHNYLVGADEHRTRTRDIIVIHDRSIKFSSGELIRRDKQRKELMEKHFLDELNKNPSSTRALFYLGNFYKDYNEIDKAMLTYKKLLKYTYNMPLIYQVGYNLAQCVCTKGKFNEAQTNLERLVKIAPWRSEAKVLFAKIALEKGDYAIAIKWAKESICSKLPDSHMFLDGPTYFYEPYRILAEGYFGLEDKNKALENINKALEYEPEHKGLIDIKRRINDTIIKSTKNA